MAPLYHIRHSPWPSLAIPGHFRQSQAISGHPWPSSAISGENDKLVLFLTNSYKSKEQSDSVRIKRLNE